MKFEYVFMKDCSKHFEPVGVAVILVSIAMLFL